MVPKQEQPQHKVNGKKHQSEHSLMAAQNGKRELVLRIANLMKENKELTEQVNDLRKSNQKLTEQKEHYERILAKIPQDAIPENVKPKVEQRTLRFKMATVLFINIEGFHDIARQQGSQKVIDELDELLLIFDQIVKKHKLQKIKTIGDVYMAAGGVPEKNITNPVDVVMAALEMRAELQRIHDRYKQADKTFWRLKMGIHTGAVTATIHGKKKLSYDIKGDTVHIATRMAAAVDAGKINISIMTYELVKEYFACEYFGKIPAKYQGDMEIYQLKRIKPAFSEDRKKGIKPNEIFNTKYKLRQFTDLQEFILDKLEHELPDNLYYHNVKHTIDVVNQAELIGYGEGVDDKAILLLKTAALFHDAGHTINFDDHEYYGTQLAKQILPRFNYTDQEIEAINTIIMATQMPPEPKTLLEKIICDSDLDYLGRSDFIPVSNTLYKEMKAHNKIDSINEWNKLQVKFLSQHQFFTETANKLREVNKQKQIDRIKQLIVEEV